MTPNRREFLLRSRAAAIAATGLAGTAGFQSRAWGVETNNPPFPQPCTAASWQKKGIVLQPDEAWEDQFIDASLSTVEPLENGRWRIWYAASASALTVWPALRLPRACPASNLSNIAPRSARGNRRTHGLQSGICPADGSRRCRRICVSPMVGTVCTFSHTVGKADDPSSDYLAADSHDGRRFRVLDPERPSLYSFWDSAADKKFLPLGTLRGHADPGQLPDGQAARVKRGFVERPDPREERPSGRTCSR